MGIYTRKKKLSLSGNEYIKDGIIDEQSRKWDVSLQDIFSLKKSYQTLTSAATITMNIESGLNAKLVLGHNVVLTLDNLTNGSEGNIIIVQNASNFTLSILPGPYVINGGGGSIVLTDGAGAITILSYTYDGTNLYINYGSNYTA